MRATPPDQQAALRARLTSAEETLRAIQSGEVDALMVSGRHGKKAVPLQGGEPNYRMLVEAMSEGVTRCTYGSSSGCRRRQSEPIG
jgi:predicted regulator of Ras-like GTPase activity (Roadblock/LC7/MglB family)